MTSIKLAAVRGHLHPPPTIHKKHTETSKYMAETVCGIIILVGFYNHHKHDVLTLNYPKSPNLLFAIYAHSTL